LFAAGRVFGEDTHRRDRLMSILASLDTGSLGVLPSSVRAGAVAAVELLEDASAQNAPRYTKQLAERASGVLELVTESLSARLGRTVDSNTEKLILSSVESRLNSGDPLVRRSSLAVIAAGAEKGSKSFTQQLDAIIKAGGGSAVEMTEIAFGQRIDVEVLRVLARTAEGNGPFVAVRCFAKLYRRQRTIQSVDNRSPSSRLLRQAPAWLRGIAVVSRMGTGSGLTNFQLENLPPWYRIGINTGALSDGDAEALRALVGNKAAGAEWDVVRALAAVYLNRSAESTSVLRDSMALWHSSNPPESDRKLLFTATPWNVRLAIDHPELGLSWSHAEKIQESWHSTGISDVDWTSKVAEYAVSVLTSGTWSDSSVKVRAAMKRLERQGRGSRRWWALGIGALEMYRACPKEIAPLDFIEYVLMCEPTGVGNKEIVPIIRFPSGISGRQLAWIRRIFEHLPLAGPLHEETERALLVAAERYDDLSVFELLARGSIDAFDNVADRALALATPRPGDASPALLGKLWQSKVTHNIGKCHTLVNLSKASAFDDVGVSHLIECIASQNAHRIERQDLVAHLLASSRSPKVVSAARAVVARLLSPFEDLDDWVDLGLGRQVGVCFFVTGL
ncbi:MAG TPA: hypothetical protein VFN61_15640, partial [Acidimicrobiales bacterium]|nr:hypothetical protein [Acidimicrobiales bacterium]